MELTVDQALQQGIAAHKEGKLQDAERLYRAILQAQPNHPDANHNLGVLAASVGKPLEAIPFFKLAVEANPQIEQFWLSYIDALIKAERFDEAKHVLVEAEKSGVSPETLDALNLGLQESAPNDPNKTVKGQTLSEKRKKLADKKKSKKRKARGKSAGAAPSQDQVNHLIGHYQSGRFGEAEALATSITQQFPKHPFGWKVLGTVLKQTSRLNESLAPMQSAVMLSPQDAEAHNNLGNTLKALGRLDEAEASLRQALALKPDYAEAHSNLGNLLQELCRLDEAEASLRQATTLKPDYAEAHSSLGNTLKELGRLDEAEASYRQAITLKPDYAEAHGNMGVTLQDLVRLEEAEASYRQAITLKPDYAEAHSNLGITLRELGRLDEAEASFRRAITLKPDHAETHSMLGNTLKELGRLDEAEASYTQAIALKPEDFKTRNQLLMCLFQQDKTSVFFDELDYLINQDKASAIIGSLACRSSLKYGLEKPNLFCSKPLNYVLHNDLNARYDFEKTFVKTAKSILDENQIPNRRQSLLVNGNQTSGNIFDIINDDTNEIQNIIRTEVEKYREKFKKSAEGLIKKMPTEYSLYGWLISMKSGGNLRPHIHTEGWLSGSIYINVPKNLKVDCGNLVVALGEENDAIDTHINEKKTINVVTGSMVLFPASLMHYTIPFESEEERIVLAFDVREK
jgi:Flp pilus assembly protein TadD